MPNDNEELPDLDIISIDETEINTDPISDILVTSEELRLKGSNILERKIAPVLMDLANGITQGIRAGFKSIFDNIIVPIDTKWKAYNKANDEDQDYILIKELGYPPKIITYMDFWRKRSRFIGAFQYLFFVTLGMINALFGEIMHLKTRLVQEANKETPISIPDPSAIMKAKVAHNFDFSTAEEMLNKLGLNTEAKQVYLDLVKQLAPVQVLYENLWRDKITPKEFVAGLARLGFDEDQQTMFTNLVQRIPPVQDIIRFAVREAFSDELSEKFSHDEDYPAEFGIWAEKQGYSNDVARKYWRAHWQIPSPGQGYQFLHRRATKRDGSIFDDKDLDDMLKMADYAPEYRNLLAQVSYRVLSRVDVRRIYKLGVFHNIPGITAEEMVYQTYLDLSYKPKDARTMTKFTIQYNLELKRNMVKTELKNLYKKGLVTASYLTTKMGDLGFLEEDITYTVMEGDYELQQQKTEKFLKYAQSMYFNGRWDTNQVIIEINKVGLPVVDHDRLFEIWNYEKKTVRRIPTKSDVMDWLEKGILSTPDKAVNYLMDLGYSEDVANNYVNAKIGELG